MSLFSTNFMGIVECTKGSRLNFFLIFSNKMDVNKSRRDHLFTFFGSMRLFKIIISRFFRMLFIVSKGPPFNFFDILQQTGIKKKLEYFRFKTFFFSEPARYIRFLFKTVVFSALYDFFQFVFIKAPRLLLETKLLAKHIGPLRVFDTMR